MTKVCTISELWKRLTYLTGFQLRFSLCKACKSLKIDGGCHESLQLIYQSLGYTYLQTSSPNFLKSATESISRTLGKICFVLQRALIDTFPRFSIF